MYFSNFGTYILIQASAQPDPTCLELKHSSSPIDLSEVKIEHLEIVHAYICFSLYVLKPRFYSFKSIQNKLSTFAIGVAIFVGLHAVILWP